MDYWVVSMIVRFWILSVVFGIIAAISDPANMNESMENPVNPTNQEGRIEIEGKVLTEAEGVVHTDSNLKNGFDVDMDGEYAGTRSANSNNSTLADTHSKVEGNSTLTIGNPDASPDSTALWAAELSEATAS